MVIFFIHFTKDHQQKVEIGIIECMSQESNVMFTTCILLLSAGRAQSTILFCVFHFSVLFKKIELLVAQHNKRITTDRNLQSPCTSMKILLWAANFCVNFLHSVW